MREMNDWNSRVENEMKENGVTSSIKIYDASFTYCIYVKRGKGLK